MGRLAYWVAVNAHYSLPYKTRDPACDPSSLPFAFLLSIENMGSTLYLFMFMRFLLLLTSFYLMVANSSSSMRQPLCHDSESSALLQFKQSFLIDEYASDDPSAYPEVATSCLYGSINSSSTLFSLVHLRRLDLSDNHFNYSVIPFGVGQLSRLRSLELSYSRLSGQIPSELLALSKLVFLDLSANPMLQLRKPGLRNLVQNLTHLKKLHLSQWSNSFFHGKSYPTHLDLSSNDFNVGTLAWLGKHTKLTYLYLDQLNLTGEIPSSLVNMSELTILSLSRNQLIGQIPSWLMNLTRLTELYLEENKLEGPIPSSLFELVNLQSLYLHSNYLTGTNQDELELLFLVITKFMVQFQTVLRWSKMRILDLASNMLQGSLPVPPPSTYIYSVSGNKLTGEIPPLICNLTSLRSLDLSDNNFSGGIPQCLTNLSSSLFVLNLRGNNLHGAIPQICTNTSSLRMIDLSGNQLQGQIFRSLANCIMVEELVLGNNMINDNFPSWLGSLPRLQTPDILTVIDLSSNKFYGEIPESIGDRKGIQALNLSNNALTGPIPTSLANLTLLEALDLSQNKLSREIPQQLVQLTFLAYFNVSHNHLTGPIPQGKQFATFPDTSFDGNPGLCGIVSVALSTPAAPASDYICSCNFNGMVPTVLGNLTQLVLLDLSYNSFKGQLPSSLANLIHLNFLDISRNDFSVGTSSWIGKLTKLTLGLGCNNLEGPIPSSIFELLNLNILYPCSNKLSGKIPSLFCNLHLLYILDLSNNNLSGLIPQCLNNSRNSLLVYNQLEGQIPRSLGNCKELEILNLGNNQINDTLPFWVYPKIPHSFKAIDLSSNKFTGEIPKSIGKLGGLHLLNISSNSLTEGEREGSDCCSWDGVECDRETGHVIGLHLASSCLYGSINSSSTLFSLVHLQRLDLSDNDFNYSEIPFGVGQLSRLRSLDLSFSGFSGQIPSELLALSKLVFLDLSANPNFSGELPTSIGRLGSLTELDISSCNFTGSVPSSLGHLTQLYYLDLSNNHFKIPFSLVNMSQLNILSLYLLSNYLNGTVELQLLSKLKNLIYLQLSDNRLSFLSPLPVPPPSTVEYLVSGNKLTGEISPLICNMTSLELLDLSSNNLSGRIPQCLANFSRSLFVLDLGSNSLDGPIPEICTVSHNLNVIDLGDNQFQGQIPRSLRILDTFMAIDFSGNNFKGQIPTSIGSLKGIHLLNLGGNDLTGHIPSSLGNLTQLESLDLSQNKLSGEIPWQLTRLTFLEFFNVSHNHLTGHIPQGKQFATFENASFDGNLGLCGSPLSRECGSSEALPPTSSSSKQGSTTKFDWKIVLMGYGSGLLIGVSIGQHVTNIPSWIQFFFFIHKSTSHKHPAICHISHLLKFIPLVLRFKMANGSLEDRIFRRGDFPLSWQPRFRIAAEISTGLLFPHQTKSEPQVHHDLKLASILLDPNYVSKISGKTDLILARLCCQNSTEWESFQRNIWTHRHDLFCMAALCM
ncbi:unnamed protein product, partial [Vitis vinifera]